MATGRILIIASYNGSRHETGWSPSKLLETQHQQLNHLNHHLDKVLIVANESDPSEEYETALSLFPDVLRRKNIQGSYGAWKDGYLANPNYEWYFFLEDDYSFFIDDFDQKWIDLWKPTTTYLASKVGTDHNFPIHASISNGLTRGDILKNVNWEDLIAQFQYDAWLQIGWSDLFGRQGLADIREHYSVPFLAGTQMTQHGDASLPILIGPIQALPALSPREASEDRHRMRMMEDSVYRATHET